MKTFVRTIIAGAVILVIGIVVIAVALGINGWQIDGDFEMQTYECKDTNTSLDIDFSAGILEMEYYDGEFIKIEYPQSDVWTANISESDGKLSFETTGKFKWNGISSWFMKFPTTKVWIPRSLLKLDFKLEMDAGTAKLLDDGSYDNFTIIMNAGTLSIGNMTCERFDLHLNAGNINTKDIVSNVGVSFDLSAGNLNIQSLTCPTLGCQVIAGSASIRKLLSPTINVNLSAGSVKLEIIGLQSDYNIDVDKSAGSCNVSNQKGEAKMYLKADVSAGSLNVTFLGVEIKKEI